MDTISKSDGNVIGVLDGVNDVNRPLIEGNAEIPIACILSGDDLSERQDEAGGLLDQAQQVRELTNGYAFEYPSTEEWANKLLAFIVEERECCPFFTFELVFEANKGSTWLRLGGSPDIKEFIKAGLVRP